MKKQFHFHRFLKSSLVDLYKKKEILKLKSLRNVIMKGFLLSDKYSIEWSVSLDYLFEIKRAEQINFEEIQPKSRNKFPPLVRTKDCVIVPKEGLVFVDKIARRNKFYLVQGCAPFHPLELKYFFNLPRNLETKNGDWLLISGRSFAHWLLQDLPRFLFAFENTANAKVIVSLDLPRYVLDFIELLALDEIELERTELARVEGIIFCPTEDFYITADMNQLMFLRELGKDLLDQIEPPKISDYIYIARRNDSREFSNQRKLEELLASLKFEVIMLEDLHFLEQVSLFQNAKVIAANHGAALANMVWANKSLKIVEIYEESRATSLLFQDIAQQLGHSLIRFCHHESQEKFLTLMQLEFDIEKMKSNDNKAICQICEGMD